MSNWELGSLENLETHFCCLPAISIEVGKTRFRFSSRNILRSRGKVSFCVTVEIANEWKGIQRFPLGEVSHLKANLYLRLRVGHLCSILIVVVFTVYSS